ncbi:MAG TPA: thiamine phosphate synthase [Thalassobaculum sp.]
MSDAKTGSGAALDERAPTQLYLITPPRIDDPDGFAERLAEALDAGPIACLQIRLKDVDDGTVRRVTERLLPVAHARGVPVLMNDSARLAQETGCDGVHIGQEDTPYAEARRLLGGRAMIGVTCKASRHLAMEAADAGADYVAFGAFFPTDTKQTTTRAPLEVLEWWQSIAVVPCVAIGGITPDNCGPLVRAGADFLAVVGAVWNHPDGPAAAVGAFERAMAAAMDSVPAA